MELGLWVALVLVAASSLYWSLRGTAFGALLLTIVKLIACKGRRAAGALTGLWFPISVEELTGPRGPKLLTKMLQHGQHLPLDVSVLSVQHLRTLGSGTKFRRHAQKDFVPNLPETFFVKFNLQSFGAMRLLVATSDVCLCEALFYHHLAEEAAEVVKTPKCFFVDFNRLTGEMWVLCSLSGRFGLGQTVRRTLRGQAEVNEDWMTWDVPGDLKGKEQVYENPAQGQ
eukprot:g21672.t1